MQYNSTILDRAMSAVDQGEYKLGAGGLSPKAPRPFDAGGRCDCSGFVCWCLQISRVTDDPFYVKLAPDKIAGKLVGWINTTGMLADGRSPDGLFDLVPDDQAEPGDIWVFGPGDGRAYGHTGIISHVVNGYPYKVIHCSAGNKPHAVMETGVSVFERPGAIIVRYMGSRVAAPRPAAVRAAHGYRPPADSLPILGGIAALVSAAPRVAAYFKTLKHMCRLPGALFYDAGLQLDTDGEQEPGVEYESTHQSGVSLRGKVNSNRVPYIVLPGAFYPQHNIRLGDVAAVLYGNRLAFAVFADVGPRTKIGEGSIALHRKLGCERIKDKRIVNVGIPSDVLTLVFPGSGNGTAQTPEAVDHIGRQLFGRLGGNP